MQYPVELLSFCKKISYLFVLFCVVFKVFKVLATMSRLNTDNKYADRRGARRFLSRTNTLIFGTKNLNSSGKAELSCVNLPFSKEINLF